MQNDAPVILSKTTVDSIENGFSFLKKCACLVWTDISHCIFIAKFYSWSSKNQKECILSSANFQRCRHVFSSIYSEMSCFEFSSSINQYLGIIVYFYFTKLRVARYFVTVFFENSKNKSLSLLIVNKLLNGWQWYFFYSQLALPNYFLNLAVSVPLLQGINPIRRNSYTVYKWPFFVINY